ncbi:hypothetical protein [Bacillus niameyensis]|uniref:hypothetical protein n=1 Tax=Bacillus niameyensis TaxID=1522308 RepID=UPI000784A7BA|nr:hypothetical protein [Bacillus niameyensis]
MKKTTDMSIEELFDLEAELRVAKDEEKGVSLPALITVEEELYEKVSADKTGKYQDSLNIIKKNLVDLMIRYGPYLKTIYQRDDLAEEKALSQALKYDRGNPYAYYRLGYLAYKRKNYLTSAVHFNNALKSQERRRSAEYLLTEQQKYMANMHLSNCALNVALQAQKALEEETVGAPLLELVGTNENILKSHALTVTSQSGVEWHSMENCQEMIKSDEFENYLILYFSEQQHSAFYKKQEVNLSFNQAELLKTMMLQTSKNKRAVKEQFQHLFSSRDENGEIPANIMNRALNRLKRKLAQCQVPANIIISSPEQAQYYYNQEILYLIIEVSGTL